MAEVEDARTAWVERALERYERPLVAYALRLTGNLEQARDVVQDTFLRLCASERERVDDHLGPWLFHVCRNRALDVLRKEHRMDSLTDAQAAVVASARPAPSAIAERREATDHVLGILDELPANQQEVIRLKFQHGMSYKEISEITGHSVSNVGYLIHTGIKAIRRQIQSTTGLPQEA